MPYSNVIVNGSFNLGNTGWTGTDLETNYNENAYLANGSTNRVAEMDGVSSKITVMRQTVKLSSSHTTSLTFRTALRKASAPGAGEGFRVDIVNSSNVVIVSQSFFPTSGSWATVSIPVTFPSAGSYTVRFTELGPNNSLGAIIDDVSMLACFTSGTLIETAVGARPVDTLLPGDLIWTQDAGLLPLRWIGQRKVSIAEQIADMRLRPVQFALGALGDGLPRCQMTLSQQHRVCLEGWRAELYFAQPQVLVPAKALINDKTIRVSASIHPVTYVHFLLDGHQIVRGDGVLSESFYPSAMALAGLDAAARAELLTFFPALADFEANNPQMARTVLRKSEALVLL